MSKEYFITNKNTIDSFLVQLKEIENQEESFTKIFEDISGNRWQLTNYWIETLNKNIQCLFCINFISFKILYFIICESKNIDEIAAASTLIYFNKFDNEDGNRVVLLNYLESIYKNNEFDNKKIKIIIYETELGDSTNKRSILNKSYEEILIDSQYYNNISMRAKKLL